MHTVRLETVYASVSVATARCLFLGGWGIGPQMNKFEQVSSDHHQMSLAGGAGVGPQVLKAGGGGVPYHVTYPMMDLMKLYKKILPSR